MAISFGFSVPFLPGMYVEVAPQLRIGPPKARILCCGIMWPTGEATPGEVVAVGSREAAQRLFGRGSPLERTIHYIWLAHPYAEVWAFPQAAPTEGAEATAEVLLTGTASGAGALSLYIAGQLVRVPVVAGETAAAIADKVSDYVTDPAVNPYAPDLPVTASASSATVTLTAKAKGTWGNAIDLRLNHRGTAAGEVVPPGLTVSIAPMADGGGAVAYDLDAVGDEEYDTVVWPYAGATDLEAVAEWMRARWSPYRMLYGHAVTAMVGTYEDLVSASAHLPNSPHLSVYVAQDIPTAPWEIAGAIGGLTDAYQMSADDATLAQGFYGHTLTGVLRPREGKGLTGPQRNVLVSRGYGTLAPGPSGVYLEVTRTTYLRNAQGLPDVSLSEQRTMAILQRMIRRDRASFLARFLGAVLAPDGTRLAPGVRAVTPSIARAHLLEQYYSYERVGWVTDAEGLAQDLVVEINAQDPNRLDILYPPRITGWLSRIAAKYSVIYGGD